MAGTVTDDNAVIQNAIEENGFRLVPAGAGAMRVVRANGRPVVDEQGTLILGERPDDTIVQRLLDTEVLAADPRAQNGDRGFLQTPEHKAKVQAGYQRWKAEQDSLGQAIWARLENLAGKLGGWDERGVQAEISRTIHQSLMAAGFEGMDAATNPSWASHSIGRMRKGEMPNPRNRARFEAFLADLDASPEPLDRYRDLALLAIHGPPAQPADGGAAETPPVPAAPPQTPEMTALITDIGEMGATPTLALQAMFLMGLGAQAHQMTTVIAVGERILALELNNRQT